MTYEEIISQVSTDTGLAYRLVDKTYRAYWKAIREYIKSLPLKEDLTDEEFMQLRPNINLPSLGKLNVTLDRYHGMKKHFEIHYKNYKGKKYKKQDNNAEDNKD
jgi:hypothetical protein